MSNLEQQCEEIRKRWFARSESAARDISILGDYIDQLRPSDATVLVEQAGYKVPELHALSARLKLLGDSEDGELVAECAETIVALLRPSDAKEIADIQDDDRLWTDEGIDNHKYSKILRQRRTLLHALAESQRECARLHAACEEWHAACEEWTKVSNEQQAEIDRLQSPPEERRDIVQRNKERRRLNHYSQPAMPTPSAILDIDTLLQDVAKYRNSHIILLGERDAAREMINTWHVRAEAHRQAKENAEKRVRDLEDHIQAAIEELLYDASNGTSVLKDLRSALASPLPTALAQPQAEQIDESKCLAIHAETGRQEYVRCAQYPHCPCGGPQEQLDPDDKAALKLCSDCPPAAYPTDVTRCKTCPLRGDL